MNTNPTIKKPENVGIKTSKASKRILALKYHHPEKRTRDARTGSRTYRRSIEDKIGRRLSSREWVRTRKGLLTWDHLFVDVDNNETKPINPEVVAMIKSQEHPHDRPNNT